MVRQRFAKPSYAGSNPVLASEYQRDPRGNDDSRARTDAGGTAPKIGKKTLETKKLAVEKARATRAARGTLGKKAKHAIKGKV